jgi:hypothetical protein
MMYDADLARRAELAAEARVLRRFWRAVLVHNLREAAGAVVNTGSNPGHHRLIQERAFDWIGSRGFRDVCDMAGLSLTAEEARAAVVDKRELFRPASRWRG